MNINMTKLKRKPNSGSFKPKPESEKKIMKSIRLHPDSIKKAKYLASKYNRTFTDIIEISVDSEYKNKEKE